MKLKSLILGSIASAGLSVGGFLGSSLMGLDNIYTGHRGESYLPRHRHGGAVAHRKWKRNRASGRS